MVHNPMIDMSESPTKEEEERLKQEKLDQARKRFETLKKKNKKKNKSKKKQTKEENISEKQNSSEQESNDVGSASKDETTVSKIDTDKAEPDDNQNQNQNQNDNEGDVKVVPKEKGSKGNGLEEGLKKDKEDQKSQEDAKRQNINKASVSIDDDEMLNAENQISSDKSPEEIIPSKEGDEESTNLISGLRSQIKRLTNELNQSFDEVKQLKRENSDLKVAKISAELELEDVKNNYETAQEQIKRLQSEIIKLKADKPEHGKNSILLAGDRNSDEDSDVFSYHTPRVQNSQALYSRMTSEYPNDDQIRQKLNSWKGYNVDMRDWRSVGMGPILKL